MRVRSPREGLRTRDERAPAGRSSLWAMTAPRPEGALAPEHVATLVANHRRFLAFLERRLGDRALAEDVLQQAFVRGIERGGTLRQEESAVAWFFRLLRNAVADHHRRKPLEGRALEDLDPALEPAAPGPETVRELCACIDDLARTLKPEYAVALRRIEVEGASLADFAHEHGITAGNAAVRVHRARAALRERVQATCRTCAEHGCLDCSCGKPKAP